MARYLDNSVRAPSFLTLKFKTMKRFDKKIRIKAKRESEEEVAMEKVEPKNELTLNEQ